LFEKKKQIVVLCPHTLLRILYPSISDSSKQNSFKIYGWSQEESLQRRISCRRRWWQRRLQRKPSVWKATSGRGTRDPAANGSGTVSTHVAVLWFSLVSQIVFDHLGTLSSNTVIPGSEKTPMGRSKSPQRATAYRWLAYYGFVRFIFARFHLPLRCDFIASKDNPPKKITLTAHTAIVMRSSSGRTLMDH
jgi:hypothetical protein